MNRRISAAILGTTCALAALTGCHSSATATTGGAGVTATATRGTATTDATPTTAAASAKPVDVCSVLPATSAAQLSGQPITTADTKTGVPGGVYGCNYGNADDSVQVEVTVFEIDAATSYDTFLTDTPHPGQVSGLGDKAFYDNDGTLYVLDGTALIQVNGLNTADASAALAKPILAAL